MTAPAAPRRVFRTPSAIIGAIVSVVVGALLLGDAWVRAGLGESLLVAPWVLLVLWVVYAFAYAPCVITDGERIELVGPFRRVSVPWARVVDVSLRWQIVVRLASGATVRASGGPMEDRRSRRHSRGAASRTVPPAIGDLALIREQWDAAIARGAASGPVAIRWNTASIAVAVALGAWAVVAVLLTR